jgi:hypothetical protein
MRSTMSGANRARGQSGSNAVGWDTSCDDGACGHDLPARAIPPWPIQTSWLSPGQPFTRFWNY